MPIDKQWGDVNTSQYTVNDGIENNLNLLDSTSPSKNETFPSPSSNFHT